MEDLSKVSSQDLVARVYALKRGYASENYERAKLHAQPLLDELNRRAQTIATKYGKKHKPFQFVSFGRNIGKGVT